MHEALVTSAKAIRLLLLDIDGIMTDGIIYYGPQGMQYKGFHIQDGLGIKLLQQIGVQVGIISGKKADYIYERLTSLNIDHIYLGYENKLPIYEKLRTTLGLKPEQVAYMGDDLLDIAILQRVGLSITVPDGNPIVQRYTAMITKRTGGKGAVREVCDFIIQAQDQEQAVINSFLT